MAELPLLIGMPEARHTPLDELRRRSAEQLLIRYEASRAHGQQVSRLAVRMAEQLAGDLLIGDEDRTILYCAALLHDTGWHCGRNKHHRHTYRLIKEAGLSGFTAEQIERIALVARYHRKAMPKLRHRSFAQLDPLGRQTVMKLAGILRLADGLDRTHRAAVEDVEVLLSRRRIELVIQPRFGDIREELMAAVRKKKLLEIVLAQPLVLVARS